MSGQKAGVKVVYRGQSTGEGPLLSAVIMMRMTKNAQAAKLTDPSDALAPTLSPVAFQHTSKIPPVPR